MSSTLVFLGLVRVSDANASFVQRFQVPSTDFSIHEQYNARTIANDICLLHLPSEAIINSENSKYFIELEVFMSNLKRIGKESQPKISS